MHRAVRPAARPAVRNAAAADRPAVAAVLARAFADDPALSWILPRPALRHPRLHRFFAGIGRIDADPAHWHVSLAPDGEVAAAAMWRPPGGWATPPAAMLRAAPALIATFGTALPRALGVQAMLEAHHPAAPHWYLQYVGCDPDHQGRGHGSAVIRARLAHCDATRLPAALETATEANVGIYQTLGFRITETFRYKGGPLFWAMWRDPA